MMTKNSRVSTGPCEYTLQYASLIRISLLRSELMLRLTLCLDQYPTPDGEHRRTSTQQIRHGPLDKELDWEHNNHRRPQSSCISTFTFLFLIILFRFFYLIFCRSSFWCPLLCWSPAIAFPFFSLCLCLSLSVLSPGSCSSPGLWLWKRK